MADTKYTGPFEIFRGGFNFAYGLKPDGDTSFPLIESCDIQAAADGTRLDKVLEDFRQELNNLEPGGTPAENLDEEIAEQYSLVEQIRRALLDKINVVGISKIEKTSSDGNVDTYTIFFTDGDTTTFTVTNAKSAYEYAQEAGYKGTEAEFAEKLAREEDMIGTWVFNDILTAPSDEAFELEFIANANSNSYTGIKIAKPAPNVDFRVMHYTRAGSHVLVYAFNDSDYDDIKPHWQDNAYKTIEIVKEPDNNTAAWIRANAKKSEQQQEDAARLKTKSKRIVEAINELSDKIDAGGGGTGGTADTFIDVTSIPTKDIKENAFYRYTESIKKFYAVTTTSRNIVDNDGQIMTVEVKDVETLPTVAAADPVTNLSDKITLYYQHSDGKVYGAINNIILMAAFKVSSAGWYEPTYAIKNYAGVIDNVLDAEYGYVYVVREIETKIHILYYKNGAWHEAVNDYTPRLGEVSREKFESTPNESVNVSGYRSISNDYDRVYVESAGNSGVSGDYCLTPDAENLPTDPWTAASEDKVVRLPSIPVRDTDGGISVYTDDDSSPDKAVSKRYFNKNTVQYVRRKPEESSEVANANLVSAHTWTPDNSLYEKYAETFDDVESIPMVADITENDLVAIFSESNANNSISVQSKKGDTAYLSCNHPTSAQSKYRLIRRGTENELVLSFDIKIAPASDLVNNRGFTMVAKNDILADTSMWGGSNLTIEYPKGGSGYNITFLCQTKSFDYVNSWVNLRIEMDGLGKDSPARLYLNNTLVISGAITESVASIKAYDFMIYNWNNSNSGFRGNILIDNLYFGDVPDTVRYSGYDTLTPIAYDYEDERVQSLGFDTLVTRKPDGAMLTKKELTEEDDDRTAASKYYVDQASENSLLNITVTTDYPTTMLDVITAIEEAGGTASDITFVKLFGYTNATLLMSFDWRGGNNYEITCSNPFTGEVFNDGNGNVYDITTARIGGFLDAGRPAVRLPNIRFVSSTCIKDENEDIVGYRFTVENMGGGTLQEGDKLQICCKRSYFGAKQKLRKMAEYVITYEDIGQRFLKIEVDTREDRTQKWLFRNNRNGNSSLSAMYFRFKRVTKTIWNSNDEEVECDAIFSNIETVMKTYSKSEMRLNIK